MFQPQVKYEFVRHYCHPTHGWDVFVDIDASEKGRTGSKRITKEALERQRKMQTESETACRELQRIGAYVGGNREAWYREHRLPRIIGDRDIIAFNTQKRLYLIAEVEAESSGQPEQKLYKAIGQIVMAASNEILEGWERKLVLVVYGDNICKQMARVSALEKLGVSAVVLDDNNNHGRWLFGDELTPS